MTKSVTILGATGSVGASTLDIIRQHPNRFNVVGLTANSRVTELAKLAIEFGADYAVIADPTLHEELATALSGSNVKAYAGEVAMCELAAESSDILVSAIVGAAGLHPTLSAVRRGATIVLANKECLVCAGELFHQEVEKHKATILPADSEHNAIFQVFEDRDSSMVERLILTASGGPFLNHDIAELGKVTPAQAVAHPNWDMGAKISVDSATMMNKGLEIIEAFYLFPVTRDQIDVLVHPQSIIHSMVEYIDGSVLAQLGSPDMRTPLAYCLGWPERIATRAERLDFLTINDLSFQAPDFEKFRCLQLAKDSLAAGGSAPAILNAANEVAVEAFLQEKINFPDIAIVVEDVLNNLDMKAPQSISNVIEIDQKARETAAKAVKLIGT